MAQFPYPNDEGTTMSAGKKMAAVVIDIDDVRRAGGVRQAIAAACEASDTVACGVIGQSFATSGPGPGWSKTFGADDFASRAFEGGALAYLDLDDGRVKRVVPVEDGENSDEAAKKDPGGCWYTEGDWSEESEVYVECPSEEDALEHPAAAAEMARAVIEHHHPLSPVREWRKLIAAVRAAGDAFGRIDAGDLPAE